MIDLPFKILASDTGFSFSFQEDSLINEMEFYAIVEGNNIVRICVNLHRVIAAKIGPFGGNKNSFERIGAIENSPWLLEIKDQRIKYYPNTLDTLADVHHFYFRGSDFTIEIICEKFDWVIRGQKEIVTIQTNASGIT